MSVLEILIVFLAFVGMEVIAWLAHRYLMHGFLWFLHRDHHVKTPGIMEKNDTFFLIFAAPSWLFIIIGSAHSSGYAVSIGLGIAMYGLAYALVHEVFIHQRLPFFRLTKYTYWEAVRLAHKIHHSHLGKDDGENFGMLWVHPKYIRHVRNLRENN